MDLGSPSGGSDGEENGVLLGFINSPASEFLVTDIDGDGIQDLALVEFPDSTTPLFQATIMMGQGNGKFAAPVRTPILPAGDFENISDFIFADFRNSGTKDFVGMSYDDGGFCTQPNLVYAQNLGNGKLGPPAKISFSIPNACFAISVMGVGDFNHDGKLDFAIASPTGTGNTEWQLTIFLGNGDGTFVQTSQLNVPLPAQGGGIPYAMWVEDANQDGKLDVLVWIASNDFGSGVFGKSLQECLGNGDGTFQPAHDVIENVDLMSMNDLNHDGLLDVIQIETTGQLNLTPAVLSIYLGKPDGTFGTPTTFMPYPTTFNSSTGNNVTAFGLGSYFGDFNGDGNTDIALFQFAQSGDYSFVQFLAGNGDGTFTKTIDSFPTYIEFAPDTIIPIAFGDGRTAFLQTPNYAASFQIIPAIVAPSLQTRFVETPVVSTMDALEIDLNVASNSDTTVNLAASDPGVQIPASATIPAGSLSVQIPFSLSASFAKNQWFSVTAQAGGTTSVAYDYALPVNFTSPFAMFVSSGGNLVPPGPVPALTPGQTSTWGVAFETFSNASSTFQVSCSNLPANLSCTNFSPPSITVAPGIPVGLTFDIPIGTNITPGLYPFTIYGYGWIHLARRKSDTSRK